MMTLPSKSFLLAAVLAVAARVPTSLGGEAAIPPSQAANPILLSPGVEFLASNPPSVVLASTFPTSELHALFETWKESFPRAYATVREAASRKLVWLENHARIEGHNGRTPPARYSLGHNDFSDLTNDEFKQRFYLGEHSPGVMMPEGRDDGLGSGSSASSRNLLDGGEEGRTDAGEAAAADVPEHKNWDEEGAVTSVKNQWFCGACWAFSAIGAIEGARFIQTGNLTELSVQQLIDCDKADLGCGGGLMSMAFQYDEDSVGLCAHEDYPFAYHRHWFWGCKRYMPYCDPLPLTKVQAYVNVTKTEVGLRAAIATQPVSVAVSAGHVDWQFYRKGVFDDGCTEKIDHGVLAVGFGTDPDAGDYWLIKNSWGARWGLDGYIRLSRGVGHEAEGGSSCVLSMASRPIMKEED